MSRKITRISVAILLLAASTAAAAQNVYRSVDRDGRVVFSDKPGASTNAAPVRTAPEPSAAQSLPVRPGPDTRQKQSYLAPPGPDGKPRAGPPETVFEAARPGLTRLGSTQLQMDFFESACGSVFPESAQQYTRAAKIWRDRHAALLDKFNTYILYLSPDQHRRIVTENLAIVGRPDPKRSPAAADQERQLRKRCDETVAEIMAGKLDRYRDPSVVDSVNAIQPR